MDVEDDGSPPGGLESRAPTEQDLAQLGRRLNEEHARYVVVGGFAVMAAGFPRTTVDLDLIIDVAPDNVARVYKALESLPDQAVKELQVDEVDRYTVVRIADEIVVDLMKSACGIDYAEAVRDVVVREIRGVPIPFASPRLLWRMKKPTHREKDAPDLLFLRQYFQARGETPPDC